MATIVDRTPKGIFYRAAKTSPVPDLDLLTLLFGKSNILIQQSKANLPIQSNPLKNTTTNCSPTPDSEHSLSRENDPIHISAEDPSLQLTVSRCRTLTHATSATLRKHFSIGAHGPGKDIVSVISTGHYLLPTLFYGVIGAGGVFSAASAASTPGELGKQIVQAGSRILITSEATREVALRAAEEAGWGANGGGKVVLMSEGREWMLRVVRGDGSLGGNLVDERETLAWERITDRKVLEESLVVLIYSSGTTGLPKGMGSAWNSASAYAWRGN